MPKPGLSPNARAIITSKLTKPVEAGARAYADSIKANVSRGPRSGEPIPGKGIQRSRPSEFPQQDEGDLFESVDARPTGNPLIWRGGFFDQPRKKLEALEWGTAFMEERAPNQRTAEQPETKQAMLTAAVKAGKGG